jgi:hypothetical protein
MIVEKLTTRQYGKLFKQLVGTIKSNNSNFDGTIEVTRLRKYDDVNPQYHGGEVDIIYRGTILAANGRNYNGNQFGCGRIRRYFRAQFGNHLNMYTRPFGIDKVKICKITFE